MSRGINVLYDSKASSITDSKVMLENGNLIASSHTLWATGAEPLPINLRLAARGVAMDEGGWFRVNRYLQSTTKPHIFAVGDCASICDPSFEAPPKAGVYAVRAGPVLVRNLVNCLEGREVRLFGLFASCA